MPHKPDTLIKDWIKRYEIIEKFGNESKEAESLFWTYKAADNEIDNSENGLQFINSILSTTQNEFVLANLAAGPLEDFLGRHGESVIFQVEQCAKTNPRFQSLLKGVWRSTIDEQTWTRVLKAISHEPDGDPME